VQIRVSRIFKNRKNKKLRRLLVYLFIFCSGVNFFFSNFRFLYLSQCDNGGKHLRVIIFFREEQNVGKRKINKKTSSKKKNLFAPQHNGIGPSSKGHIV